MIRRSRSLPAVAVLLWVLASAALVGSGCAPEIGDDCSTSIDCSANGDRICDTAQPGGYCTVRGCESGTCPSEAVCVEFRPNVDRLADRWCLFSCESNGDCRDGYRCLQADGELSRIVDDRPSARFCGVP